MSKPRISNPFEIVDHHTEWSAVIKIVQWMNECIKQNNLKFGEVEAEKIGYDGKRPDVLISIRPKSKEIICVLEFKQPYFDPFEEEELKEPARRKATFRKAPYFCTCNFNDLIWFNTAKVNELKPEEEQIVNKYSLTRLRDIDKIDDLRHRNQIQSGLKEFLLDLYNTVHAAKPEPRLPLDEFLIYRIQEKIQVLSSYYFEIIHHKVEADKKFSKNLQKWFFDQGWNFAYVEQDYEKAARQAAYLLANKILFYNVLQSKNPQTISPLNIPDDLVSGGILEKTLNAYFEEVNHTRYPEIFSTDFIDDVAFPDNMDVIKQVRLLVNLLKKYKFDELGFDVIGNIFEKLIPSDERHILGQYFTNADVVDVILRFCLRSEKDKVLDPSCGAGTFLVRSYRHKKIMNQRTSHEDVLKTLWGVDIAKFPAHLASINLAIQDLSSEANYPQIIKDDFFRLVLGGRADVGIHHRKRKIKGVGADDRHIDYPVGVDCVVGNPPYTRQEEISGIESHDEEFKEKLIREALTNIEGKALAKISKRAGIHAYFFVHGSKFLNNGGRLGFVVSNSWLDVDYGKGLQEFFLNHFKMIAIIESQVERWFSDADINTCIVILEKRSGEKYRKERDENWVRFVYLRKKLNQLISPTSKIWEQQVKRLHEIDDLIQTILAHHKPYHNEDLRIYPVQQKDLWEEGFDKDEKEYVGAKWGKYLRAPEIFFTIMEKCKDNFVQLREIADVRFGIKTGANEFFYLTEEEIKRKGIEKEFWMHRDESGNWIPNYIIKSPRECKSIVIKPEELKYRVLMIHQDKKELKGTHILKYIEWGEERGFHKRPTCASRKRWYDLGANTPWPILHPMIHNDRQLIILNTSSVYVDHNLFEIKPHKPEDLVYILCYFSTVTAQLFKEFSGRVNLGEGALKTEGIDIEKMLIFDPGKLKETTREKIEKWFEENASTYEPKAIFNVTGSDLDRILFKEAFGLPDTKIDDLIEQTRKVISDRLIKAKSLKSNRTKDGIDIDLLTTILLEKIEEPLGKTYNTIISATENLKTIQLSQASKPFTIVQDAFDIMIKSNNKPIMLCKTETEARYIKIWLELGIESVQMPAEEKELTKATRKLEEVYDSNKKVVEEYLSSIVNKKLRDKLEHRIWRKILNDGNSNRDE